MVGTPVTIMAGGVRRAGLRRWFTMSMLVIVDISSSWLVRKTSNKYVATSAAVFFNVVRKASPCFAEADLCLILIISFDFCSVTELMIFGEV